MVRLAFERRGRRPLIRPNKRFAQWFKDWRKPVRQWLSRRAAVPAAELDDLAQEVFLRLLRYSEKTAVENPLGYLLRIARQCRQ